MKALKIILIILGIMAIVAALSAENSITQQKGERVERVGNEVWFIPNFEEDSIISRSQRDNNGYWPAINFTYEKVEKVQADPNIPLQKIEDAHQGWDPIIAADLQFTIKNPSFMGLVNTYPIQQKKLHYDASRHEIISYAAQEKDSDFNYMSAAMILALIVLFLFWTIRSLDFLRDADYEKLPMTGTLSVTLPAILTGIVLWKMPVSTVAGYADEWHSLFVSCAGAFIIIWLSYEQHYSFLEKRLSTKRNIQIFLFSCLGIFYACFIEVFALQSSWIIGVQWLFYFTAAWFAIFGIRFGLEYYDKKENSLA